MPIVFDAVHLLLPDPLQSDGARGFRAEVADPLWLLGRQWQLGEHEGEDASSPVELRYTLRLTPIEPPAGQPGDDPRTTPAEAIVESEPGAFWTVGRRVATGRAVAAAAVAAGRPLPAEPALALAGLPTPYDVLDGTGPDGARLWRRRAELELDEGWFGSPAPPADEPVDLWSAVELAYDATFTAGGATLTLARHDGGDLDWWGVDADGPPPAPAEPESRRLHPNRLQYPGAPHPRWWEIEDARVDIGGYAPDRAHFPTLLLIDLVMNRSDDWFGFPVDARVGHVMQLEEVVVTDSFGETWTLAAPADWSMFATRGLDRSSTVLWATAAAPLSGPVLDEAVLGIDEDANLVWAVERRLRGRELPTVGDPLPLPPALLDSTARPGFAYRPMTRVPPRWHPYVIEEVGGRRRFVQGRAADLTGAAARLMPAAESDLLVDPASGGVHPVHQIEPGAIPSTGLRLERRAVLARRSDGSPVLWTQRRRLPLLTPPATALRFDALEEVVADAPP